MEATLSEVFGPLLAWVFGIGIVLLVLGVVGILIDRAADFPPAGRAGRYVARVGLGFILFTILFYFVVIGYLDSIFDAKAP